MKFVLKVPLLPFCGIIIYKEDIQVVGFVEKFYFDPLIIAWSGANHDICTRALSWREYLQNSPASEYYYTCGY